MKKTFDIMIKISSIITNIIIIFLIAIFIYYNFQVHIKKIDKNEVFKVTLFIVKTGSMNPTININDIIIVERTKELANSDIIAFKQEGNLIVHRIVEKNENEIITKGDFNNQEDESIQYEQVIGKVVQVIPFGLVIFIIMTIVSLNIIIALITRYTNKNNYQKERRNTDDEK